MIIYVGNLYRRKEDGWKLLAIQKTVSGFWQFVALHPSGQAALNDFNYAMPSDVEDYPL